jgi:hypothetical protein
MWRNEKMDGYIFLAYFGAGLFLANGVPHFVNGISGNRFQSPFASPPGVGESSPLVNVLEGTANFVIGYLLLYGVGDFKGGLSLNVFVVALGALIAAIGLAWHFGRVRNR